ncbi:Gfo/Idh/MocA family oxidoreductase [Plantactinospora sp. WMMC1484]|uniref:Gfo/Idh/MocA family oxidoreductase n=1 Tax=Plantactinospora sp. WMMC1484 TaxID=3404122 RepID=UPI003BF546C9
MRIVVCGTNFGRTYLAALRDAPDFRLCGILARGSERSQRCAKEYGVPLYTSPAELPDDVEAACVVVGGRINGGPGGTIARQLMARGIHVLQEHPLDEEELAECVRDGRRHRVTYRVNSHYVHLPAVTAFVDAARRLLSAGKPIGVEAQTSFLVLYPLLDILAAALGRLRPIEFAEAVGPGLFRLATGVVGGVPVAIRVQNQLDLADRDNGAHLLHRISLYTAGGHLHLADPAGPVVWYSRLHRPADYDATIDIGQSVDAALDLPLGRVLHPAAASHREVVGTLWPAAVRTAVTQFGTAVVDGTDPMPHAQYHLGVARATRQLADRLGPPELVGSVAPTSLTAYDTLFPKGEPR